MKNYILITAMLMLCASCSQYDWQPTALGGSSGAPVVSVGPDITVTNVAAPTALVMSISDSNTPLSALTMTWTGNPSNPGLVSFDTTSLQHELLFPRNGTYVLTLSVSDGVNTREDTVIVTVTASNYFALSGSVADNLTASSGVQVDLLWGDGTFIESVMTDNAGVYVFPLLVGSLENYEITVN